MVKNKLSSWKASQLSFAGRVTLSKAVVEALPLYPMMTCVIPKACFRNIKKLQRNFIWGEQDNSPKYHAVAWGQVTRPKALGGLGLRNLVTFNSACMMKLTWAFKQGEDHLWCRQVLKA